MSTADLLRKTLGREEDDSSDVFETQSDIVPTLVTNRLLVPGTNLFDPNAAALHNFHLVIVACLMYTLLWVPIRIAFVEETMIGYLVTDILIDILFLGDIVLTLFTATVHWNGTLETNQRRIWKSYARSWLIPDVLATFPFYAFSVEEESMSSRILRLRRFPRLIKLLRLFKLLKLYRVQGAVQRMVPNMNWKADRLRLSYLAAVFFSLAHVCACIWIFLGDGDGDGATALSWMRRVYADAPIESMSRSKQYLVGLYWATTTIVTLGYGDITPRSNEEIAFVSVLLVLSAFLFSYTTAIMASIITKNDEKLNKVKNKVADFHRFCQLLNVSRDTEQHIVDEMKRLWRRPVASAEWKSIVQPLPEQHRIALILDTFHDLFEVDTILNDLIDDNQIDFTEKLVAHLQPVQLMAGDILGRKGEAPDGLYFVHKGVLQSDAVLPSGSPLRKYTIGQHIGTVGLFLEASWPFTVRASTAASLAFITRAVFFELLRQHEAACSLFLFYAEKEKELIAMTQALDQRLPSPETTKPTQSFAAFSAGRSSSLTPQGSKRRLSGIMLAMEGIDKTLSRLGALLQTHEGRARLAVKPKFNS